MRYVTGIGSRVTPPEALSTLTTLVQRLCAEDFVLRSGHAAGADRACEDGAAGHAHIYLPWPGFGTQPYKDDPGAPVQGTTYVIDAVRRGYHAQALANVYAQFGRRVPGGPVGKLMLRNMAQILGHSKEPVPSELVICWHPGTGGTLYAVQAAVNAGVPVLNVRGMSLIEAWRQVTDIVEEVQHA